MPGETLRRKTKESSEMATSSDEQLDEQFDEQLDDLIDEKKEFSVLVCAICYGGILVFGLIALVYHIISKFC